MPDKPITNFHRFTKKDMRDCRKAGSKADGGQFEVCNANCADLPSMHKPSRLPGC